MPCTNDTMKMLWKVQVLDGIGGKRDGWIAADGQIQALKMAMKEGVELLEDPEEWEAGLDDQVFWKVP